MQGDNSKDEDENQSHHNEESVKPTIMSWRGKEVEENSGEWKGCHITYKWNNKQSHVPAKSRRDK